MIDVTLRQKQIKLFRLSLLAAMQEVNERFGLQAVNDGHLVWHHFTRPGNSDMTHKEWLENCRVVFLPLLRNTPGWQVFADEVQWIYNTMELLDPQPQWGCALCT